MKANEIMNSLTRTVKTTGFKLKKHSPEILVAAGIVGTITSTVMACKATTKAGDIVDDHRDKMEQINKVVEMAKTDETVEYTEQDLKKDTAIVYTQTAVKFVKLYAPSVILGAVSIGSILYSHKILTKRNAALAAAYATIDKGFKEYRGRVVERFGEQLDHELKYNIKAKEFEEVVVDEKGKEKVEKKTVEIADPNTFSDYARFFDESCIAYTKDPEMNLCWLKQRQGEANRRLQHNGYLFLNEVYEMIGLPKTKAGQVVGWIYNEKEPIGDNFVDFGLYDQSREAVRDFVNGYERAILLDFNVDGNIWDLM